ncbi:MAG TPA: PTS transporter subunit IIC, partial [Erysipelotrichaceae bacterium]|nr:PTS transporter subunit IIC [Erysipelotrichaceae bacterium]
TIAIPILSFILLLKLTEWVALKVNKAMNMEGICIPHLSGIVHFPISVIGNSIIDKIPGLNKIKSDPDTLQEKLGLLGEPMIMGLILGLLLGISAGYGFKDILSVGVKFAAVILILPMMGGILGKSLIPISEGMKTFMKKNLPNMGQTYIGLDVAVLFGLPENIVTALLLIPTSILLAIILPGVNFIPLGDLTNLLVPVAFITLATRGNIFRSYIIGIPIVVLTLYSASWMAPMLTDMAAVANFQVADTSGLFTSFLDGGNIFRTWITMIFTGSKFGFILIPIVIWLIYVTWKQRLEA